MPILFNYMEIVVMKMCRVFSAALLAASAAFAGSGYVSTEKIEPLNAPFEMPQLQRPVFPDTIFRIADFGANPAAHFNNASAINKAIVPEAGVQGLQYGSLSL
jgi:hypothetical protein